MLAIYELPLADPRVKLFQYCLIDLASLGHFCVVSIRLQREIIEFPEVKISKPFSK